jgi:hypothetical protein
MKESMESLNEEGKPGNFQQMQKKHLAKHAIKAEKL